MWDYEIYTDDVQVSNPQTMRATLNQIELNLKKAGKQGWEVVATEKLATDNANIIMMVHYLRKPL